MEQLQNLLHSLDPSDPRHAHVKTQLSKKTQLLAIMSRKHQELESRLDDMITRIHKETQEIKELEQQLTDGQIAANEALKRELEGIIAGLQEYLQGVKDQARRAKLDCRRLQREKDALQCLLCEKEQQCTQLQKEALSAKSAPELEDLRKENEELKQAQGQVSEYEAELEAQLQERDTEATQLKEELGRLRRLNQMEHSALQAELQKERQAKENALAQMQMTADRELENTELQQQVNALQVCHSERRGEEVELHRLRKELEDAHAQQYLMLQRLEETEMDRDRLLAELEERDKQVKAEESQTQEQLESLSLELQALRSSFSSADRVAAQQLTAAKDKLHSLHSTIEKIHQERNAEELQSTRIQAAQAIQDLTSAEAEIEVLQKLLIDRTDGNLHSVPNSNIQQQELDRLNQHHGGMFCGQTPCTFPSRLKWVLLYIVVCLANNINLEELLEEIGALKETLLKQNNFLSSLGDPLPNTGCWYYVPSNQNAPSFGSQGTQDSGLGSVHPQTPERGRRSGHRAHRDRRPVNRGYWIYSPHPIFSPTSSWSLSCQDSGRESDIEGVSGTHFMPPSVSAGFTLPDGTAFPPGSFIYSYPVPGLPIGSSSVLYGPPPDEARLMYGPPASNLTIPLVPSTTLHCNVPGHQVLERDLKKAERRLKEECADRAHSDKEQQALQEKTADLKREIKRLRRTVHTLQRHTSMPFCFWLIRSGLESSLSHAEEEQCVLGEVECVEKTLLKRRVELREADRLLLEAETELRDTRAKLFSVNVRDSWFISCCREIMR
uniref:Centriolin n=1 Tax=Cyprinus carpio TaxID=7962 RepID=A0A8C1GB36_CYPCA